MAFTALALLISLIFSLTVSAQQGFLSIDSGALQPYVDPATGIQWQTDGSYIDSGSNTVVSGTNITHELTTLRYFPVRNTNNCYVLTVEKGLKYFFWASFYYGNYDGGNRWPTFNLTFDAAGGQWFHELFKTVSSDIDTMHVGLVFPSNESTSISLCLSSNDVRKNVPFISAPGDVFLHLADRISFGATSEGWLGYPDDPYDRTWYLDPGPLPYTIARTINVTITTTYMPNQPPPKVMMTAFEGLNVSTFNYTMDLGPLSSKLAIYLYFMDLSTPVATDVRMFTLYVQLNDEIKHIDVNLRDEGDWAVIFITFVGSYDQAKLTISMVPTKNSTLPPIINAMELFKYDETPQPTLSSTPTPTITKSTSTTTTSTSTT